MKDKVKNPSNSEHYTQISEPIRIYDTWNYNVLQMHGRWIQKKILTYNPIRRRNAGRPQLRWGTNILFKRTEQTKHDLIYKYDDGDFYSLEHNFIYYFCGTLQLVKTCSKESHELLPKVCLFQRLSLVDYLLGK
jgi:hypothetical protein